MAKLLSGKEVAGQINEETAGRADALKRKGIVPALCVIRVGGKTEDEAYERGAVRQCEAAGVRCLTLHLPERVSQEELLCLIDTVNEDPSIHGVLLMRPLPGFLDEPVITNRLRPEKDVDCMTDLSVSGLLSGRRIGFAPCTAEAAMAFLDHYGIDAAGMRAVVIGRSLVIGKPAALMLTDRNATVTVCHTKTRDLPSVTREADLLLVAAGHPDTVTKEHVRPGQILIDVGVNMGQNQKLCGDAAFDEVEKIVGAITPVPGGVGAVTSSILVRHVVEACERMTV